MHGGVVESWNGGLSVESSIRPSRIYCSVVKDSNGGRPYG